MNQTCCVYAISCNCGGKYVGNSLQFLKDRLYQHKYAISRGDIEKSAIAQHLADNPEHQINWNSVEILEKEPNRRKRFFKEMTHIGKEKGKLCLNRNDDLNFFPRPYYNLLQYL